MLTKGTQEYAKASEIAKRLSNMAKTGNYSRYERLANEQLIDMLRSDIYKFCVKIETLNVFASAIAKTVKASTRTCNNHPAFISDKQAWCLACAAVENGISLYDDDEM